MRTRWYEQPVSDLPSGIVATPLGDFTIQFGEHHSIHAELSSPVTVYGVSYQVYVKGQLLLQQERLHLYVSLERAGRHGSGGTPAAKQYVSRLVLPPVERYIEQHSALLLDGDRMHLVRAAERGLHRLDDINREVEEWRTKLLALKKRLDAGETLKGSDRRLLNDVWSWRF